MTAQIELRPVTKDNWRDLLNLEITEAQREFIARPDYDTIVKFMSSKHQGV